MKLLLIAPRIKSVDDIKNFSGVLSYYISRELVKAGVEIVYDEPMHNKGKTEKELLKYYDQLGTADWFFDHILALPIRYWNRLPISCFNLLKGWMGNKRKITHVHDRKLARPVADCTFTISDQGNDVRNHSIGWGADPELIVPNQDTGLRILVDHSDYVDREGDFTKQILESAHSFFKPSSIIIRHFVDGNIIRYDGAYPGSIYTRKPISYLDCCREYGKTDLFMVTHHESSGLSALEASLAGALVASPKGFINPDRATTFRNVEYDFPIPWDSLINQIDISASRLKAMENSWLKVVQKIIEWFPK